jgi:hypothetical protein
LVQLSDLFGWVCFPNFNMQILICFMQDGYFCPVGVTEVCEEATGFACWFRGLFLWRLQLVGVVSAVCAEGVTAESVWIAHRGW